MTRYLDAPEASAPAPQNGHSKAARRWPLLLLALPAFVATWSGWVGLGRMVGFGVVTPLPGILDDFTIDTAITLPIGVEAYGAYALSAWITVQNLTPGTRRFAKWSALGSLLLGMLGQVAYHLLEVNGFSVAPWQVVTIVSCLPVLVLGMGAALFHMLARDAEMPQSPKGEPPVAAPVAEREEEATEAKPIHDFEPTNPIPAEPAAPAVAPLPVSPLKMVLLTAPPEPQVRPEFDSAAAVAARLESPAWSVRRGRAWSRPESQTWLKPVATDDQTRDRKTPIKQDRRKTVNHWVRNVKAGRALTKAELSEWSGWSETWAYERIREGRDILAEQGWSFDSSGRPIRPEAGRVLVANGSAALTGRGGAA